MGTQISESATTQAVYDEPWDTTPTFTRYGVRFTVVHDGLLIYGKTVWQRGTWLPRPFYGWRIKRARRAAERISRG